MRLNQNLTDLVADISYKQWQTAFFKNNQRVEVITALEMNYVNENAIDFVFVFVLTVNIKRMQYLSSCTKILETTE